MGVNYVIAAWTGPRSSEEGRARADRTFLVREHIRALESLRHSLDQITIVLAAGGDDRADGFIKSLTKVAEVPVKVLPRENTGYSYASWGHAFETYGDEFAHYIIVEDDYVPWAHDFDSILVRHAEERQGYVCGAASRGGKLGAISNGIIPTSVWKKVHPAPWEPGFTQKSGNHSQRIWTSAFAGGGHWVRDYLSTHSSPFWNGNSVRWYGDLTRPAMFMPTHAVRTNVVITTRARQRVRMRADEVGKFTIDKADMQTWMEMVKVSQEVPR